MGIKDQDWNRSELVKLLVSRLDERTSFGKQARDVLEEWITPENAARTKKKLGALRTLLMHTQEDNLAEIKQHLKEDYYVRNEQGRCDLCGAGLKREAILYSYKNKTKAQKEMFGVISKKKSVKGNYVLVAGCDCAEFLADMLEEIGIDELKRTRSQKPKKDEEALEQLMQKLSPELLAILKREGIDESVIKKAIQLEHLNLAIDGDESGLRFDIDPRNNTNTYNWFRGLQESFIRTDIKEEHQEELTDVWYKLRNAAHMITAEDLANIALYSCEFRMLSTGIMLPGVSEDLYYLSHLDSNHPFIKYYPRKNKTVNIDKHFVLPKTKFRKREGIPDRNISDVLNQEFCTRLEASGIHHHYPDIVPRRIWANRIIGNGYSTTEEWLEIKKELSELFENLKSDLHQDYLKFGEPVREYLLTKKEYSGLKYFLKRHEIGTSSPRVNCLRNHHIAFFQHVAPEIMSLYRKLKYAKKLQENKAEPDKYAVMKQEFFLTEDFEPKTFEIKVRGNETIKIDQEKRHDFSALTGLEAVTLKQFSEQMQKVDWIDNEHYQNFRKAVATGYEIGLVPKKISRYTGKKKERITLAKKYYELSKQELPTDCLVTDNFKKYFAEIAGVEDTTFDDLIEMINGTEWLSHKPYQKFRKEFLNACKKQKIPKKFIEKNLEGKICRIKKYHSILKDKGVEKVDAQTKERAGLVKKMYKAGIFEKLDCFDTKALDSEYTNKETKEQIDRLYYDTMRTEIPEEWGQAKENINELKGINIIRFDRKRSVISICNLGRATKELLKETVIIYNPAEIVQLLQEKRNATVIPKDVLVKLKKMCQPEHGSTTKFGRVSIDLNKEYLAVPQAIKDIEEEYSGLEKEIKQKEAKYKLDYDLPYYFKQAHKDIEHISEMIPGLEEFLCQINPEYKKEREIIKDYERARKGEEMQNPDAVLEYKPPEKSIAEQLLKNKESIVISYFIRKKLTEQKKQEKEDAAKEEQKDPTEYFYEKHTLNYFMQDPDIRKIGQGLGMHKRETGERVPKAYYSEKWKSYKTDFSKKNIFRMLQGSDDEKNLEKAVTGITEKYSLPETVVQNFKQDLEKQYFEEEDVDNFKEALLKVERTINDKLLSVYSIEGQIREIEDQKRALEEKRREEERKRWKEDSQFDGSGRHKKDFGSGYYGRRRGRRRGRY